MKGYLIIFCKNHSQSFGNVEIYSFEGTVLDFLSWYEEASSYKKFLTCYYTEDIELVLEASRKIEELGSRASIIEFYNIFAPLFEKESCDAVTLFPYEVIVDEEVVEYLPTIILRGKFAKCDLLRPFRDSNVNEFRWKTKGNKIIISGYSALLDVEFLIYVERDKVNEFDELENFVEYICKKLKQKMT